MIRCGDCGKEMQRGEQHHHLPDIYLDAWNCQYQLMRNVEIDEYLQKISS